MEEMPVVLVVVVMALVDMDMRQAANQALVAVVVVGTAQMERQPQEAR
jgi:hypothetical protein